jgi:pre-mRNA-processing factor 40
MNIHANCQQRARYSPRHDRKSKTPPPEPTKEEDRTLRSGSEEGEIEED